MEIILLRHGKPVIPAVNKITPFALTYWIKAYNNAILSPESKPSLATLTRISQCHAIVCSELPRSIESASVLNINNITLTDAQFNEAGLPHSNWRIIKLSPIIWVIIFRLLWLFGYSRNSESYKEAKQRAAGSAKTLIKLAKEHKSVLFIGHGIYNKLLAQELRNLGWSGPRNPGSKYWEYGIYKIRK